MRSSLRLPGTHRVVKRLAEGRVAIYIYRSRGGPLLERFEGANIAAACRVEADGAQALIVAYAAPSPKPQSATLSVRDIVTAYNAAPDGKGRLAASTAKQWSPWLDEIISEFGDLSAKALKAKGMRRAILDWRDKRSATPRTADYGLQVLKRVLSFALDREMTEANPAEGIGNLYKANRADVVVEDAELEAILANVSKHAAWAIRLAASTGMRRGDLIDLKWNEVSDFSIEFATNKSNGRRRPLVPLYPDAQAVIAELRAERDRIIESNKVPSAFVLTSHRGGPWSKDSLTQAFIRGARAAKVDKNLHDLRGTSVTRFVLAGLSDVVVADIIGWEPSRVNQVRRRYVDRDNIARGVIADLERGQKTG